MTFWLIGDEEPADPRFIAAGPGACGLYFMAGAHSMRQTRYRPEGEIPEEWFISDHWVRGWPNGPRLAARLVDNGLWRRATGGYEFAWIQRRNEADTVRAKRAAERRKWEAKQARKRATPHGRYRGELESLPAQPRSWPRSVGESRDVS